MVEAAGAERASENVTGQETACLFAFMPQALPSDVRGRRSERTRKDVASCPIDFDQPSLNFLNSFRVS